MAVTIHWLVPDQIIHIQYGEVITVEDANQSIQALVDAAEGTTNLYVISDQSLTKSVGIPISTLRELGKPVFRISRLHSIITVNPQRSVSRQVLSLFVQIIQPFLTVKIKEVDSLDEAIIVLKEQGIDATAN
jgi:hypothetical protein